MTHEPDTLGASLYRQARTRPDETFLTFFDGPSLSYAQALDGAQRLARGLADLGVGPGERVLLMAPNGPEAVAAWLALGWLGAVEVCLNPVLRGQPLAHALSVSEARLALIDPSCLAALAEQDLTAFGIARVIPTGSADWTELNAAAPLPEPARPVRGSDPASVLFTSGTTGPAKPVILTQAQNHLTATETARHLGMTEADVSYCFHPLHHMAGKFMALQGTLVAGAQIVMDRRFVPELWSQRLAETGATLAYGHGPMLEMIHATPPRAEDRQHRCRRVLSAPFPRHIAEDFEARFGVRGQECWGMTEIGIVAWADADTPRGSCGRVGEAFELAILDPETDTPLPPDTLGEIAVRPRRPWALFQGYQAMPEASVEAWRNLWFHTGDLGRLDAQGNLWFADRVKDRIRRRAENISAYEIECVALAHPAVAEAAAVGVPSGYEGDDDVKLCLILRPGAPWQPEALLAHLAAGLPHFMLPRYLDRREALPRSNTNKVQKAVLRAEGILPGLWDRHAEGVSVRDLYAKETTPC
ncbi:AMP-binding protein [Gemmobacter sp.]|uniref:AMP-binding protein n=1 Tax=Gemmobacter sp. TaxID=1898957 RepID=UPI002AFE7399|nr:AMP-binding protein [Gemmobacter sp.]